MHQIFRHIFTTKTFLSALWILSSSFLLTGITKSLKPAIPDTCFQQFSGHKTPPKLKKMKVLAQCSEVSPKELQAIFTTFPKKIQRKSIQTVYEDFLTSWQENGRPLTHSQKNVLDRFTDIFQEYAKVIKILRFSTSDTEKKRANAIRVQILEENFTQKNWNTSHYIAYDLAFPDEDLEVEFKEIQSYLQKLHEERQTRIWEEDNKEYFIIE